MLDAAGERLAEAWGEAEAHPEPPACPAGPEHAWVREGLRDRGDAHLVMRARCSGCGLERTRTTAYTSRRDPDEPRTTITYG